MNKQYMNYNWEAKYIYYAINIRTKYIDRMIYICIMYTYVCIWKQTYILNSFEQKLNGNFSL